MNDPTSVPSTIKMLQASTVLPAVEDEGEYVDSDAEPTAEKDKFHSVNGEETEQDGKIETANQTADATAVEEVEAEREDSTSAIFDAKSEVNAKKAEEQEVEELSFETDHPSPKTKVEDVDVQEALPDSKAGKHNITSLHAQVA